MPVGVRRLTVLGEFKPFGLVAEGLEGNSSDNLSESYDYFLFDPKIATELDEVDGNGERCSSFNAHELFIRGNRIIWSAGSRVLKRFTLPSAVVTACWSRLGDGPEALLCVLQAGCLTIYNTLGKEVSIPLPRTITSIWPLPYGLLLQQASEVNLSPYFPFWSSSPMLGARDIPCPKNEIRQSPQWCSHSLSECNYIFKGDISVVCSHLILRDPLQEPEPAYLDERGKVNIMKDFDERTIWTSDQIPLLASYNEGKMQHSVWTAEIVNSKYEAETSSSARTIPVGVVPKNVSFRRLWHAKGAKKAASKVFTATDDDAVPVICFLLLEQKKLLSIRLHVDEIDNEFVFDIKADMSWSLSAVAAAPVCVTRSRIKTGPLPYLDIVVLSPENTLLLYAGRQCLCRYVLPSFLDQELASHKLEFSNTVSIANDLKITGLSDAVEGCINVTLNNWQMFRCVLQRSPSSLLIDDCITAIAEGMTPNLYNHFLSLLWGDGDSENLSAGDTSVHSEWDAFCRIFTQKAKQVSTSHEKPPKRLHYSSWEFLCNSKFHKAYTSLHSGITISSGHALDFQGNILTVSGRPVEESSDIFVELLMKSLECLHAVYESLKMNYLRKRDLELLAVLLCHIAKFLNEECFLEHYVRDFPGLSKLFGTCTTSFSGRKPPSLYRWLETCLLHGCSSVNMDDLPCLIRKAGSSILSQARKIISFYSVLCGAKPARKTLPSGVHCTIATGSYSTNEELAVLAMVGERFGLQQLDLLPSGVSLPLRHALDMCRESPPTDWPMAAYVLLGREDLAISFSKLSSEPGTQTNINLISMSTPYMLHLHPVTIPYSFSDSIGMESTKFEDADSVDGSTADGMEHIFSSSTQLRYGRDLRLNEVRRVLCSARPVAIPTPSSPSVSDQEQQQDQLWRIAQRTAALPLGRGAFTLSTIYTLLTEAFTVPKLILAGRLPAQQNAVVNLDPNVRNIQELKTWPEFHNAVAAGLRLAPLQGKVSRTWIIYNKPEELNVTHAGLLFALGLQGYLHVLTISDIYQYFSQEHETTTVGLMLGLAVSYRGTMQPAISKALYVHIPTQYQTPYTDLEMPTLLQTAALMSVGLLYEGSAHPQTMQFLLGEIGRRSGGDNVLEREGHAVSAGFALGLVALGRGEDTLGSMESFVGRLFQYLGGKESHHERPLFTQTIDDHNRGVAQMMDGNAPNVDVTAPGAIVALALMYLKTESQVVVSRLSIPKTRFDLQYVRPDFIMLRVIARNLIMWSRIHPTRDWIHSQIPDIIKDSVAHLQDNADDDEIDVDVLVQAYINVVTGACISLGLRFAGSKDGNARELLYDFAIYLLNEIKPISLIPRDTLFRGFSRYVDRGTLEICLHLIVLSLSVVMAGSGDLQIFRLLRFLRSRNATDGHANYGMQMAVSLAIGFLFLGGGMRTFSTSNSSIAVLLITLYPRLPSGPNDNRCHVQAFRHLYVLATEARWVQTVDVDTGLPVYGPLEITVRETEVYSETSFVEVTPCILPERSILKRIRICGPRYWPQQIELDKEGERSWWSFRDKNDPSSSGVLYIKRKVGACSYVDDPIGRQSLLSRAMHKVFGLKTLGASGLDKSSHGGLDFDSIDKLISTFSSDPSLIAFAQLCCDPSWTSSSDSDFKDFCLQVLFECVSKDRPALLQVYLSLYTTIELMAEQLLRSKQVIGDSCALTNLKLALAYNEAVLSGKLTTSSSVVQCIFLASLRKRVDDILNHSKRLRNDLHNYLIWGRWPDDASIEEKDRILLSWYLKWFGVPSPSVVKTVVEKIKSKLGLSSSVPFLRLLLPSTDVNAIREIDEVFFSSVGR